MCSNGTRYYAVTALDPFQITPSVWIYVLCILQPLDKLQLQLDFQLASEDGADTASFIPNGEWALLGPY